MSVELKKLKDELNTLIDELEKIDFFFSKASLVIGCSTSEVQGKHIGKHSSIEVAEVIFDAFQDVKKRYDLDIFFQGCEHINRALTTTIESVNRNHLETQIVSVVPHRSAGGSLSEYAYHHQDNSVVIEHATVDLGIDIGQTLIGMHVKHVQVPVRVDTKQLGEAQVTLAKSRPKLIGGERAHYK